MELGRFRLGLRVTDVVEAAYAWCRRSSCTITSEPRLEAYGDRVFECIDPYGYLWELSQPESAGAPDNPASAARDEWFGPDR